MQSKYLAPMLTMLSRALLTAWTRQVTAGGKVTVIDSASGETVVDLPLELVLGKMPQKEFKMERLPMPLNGLDLPADITVTAALDRVLRLLAVGSKRFLVNKVDRSVTGLVAQQQCVGPLQLPLANCAVIAQSHFSNTGTAVATGEQPIKGLISSGAMARMTVAEVITNIMWARLTHLTDIKVAGNWMWAAKFPGTHNKAVPIVKAVVVVVVVVMSACCV